MLVGMVNSPPGKPYVPMTIDFENYAGALAHRSVADLQAANFVLWTLRKSWFLKVGRVAAAAGLRLRVPGTVGALRQTVFRVFCGGVNLQEAMKTTEQLDQVGVGSILDYAAEGDGDEESLDRVCSEIGRVIDVTAARPDIDFVAVKVSGLARFGLLEKYSASGDFTLSEQREWQRAQERFATLVTRAAAAGISIFVDAEHSWIQKSINDLTQRAMRQHNGERAVVLTTVQLYLRGGLDFLQRSLDDALTHQYQLGVKLVRGAYMELENERAEEQGKISPIQPNKNSTDLAFDEAITLCLENIENVTTCVATHNVKSTKHLIREMGRLGIVPNDPRVMASQLLGMFDRVTFPLAKGGYNALKYVPYGPVREAFPYLLRRADENKSVADQLGDELDAIRGELRRRGARAL